MTADEEIRQLRALVLQLPPEDVEREYAEVLSRARASAPVENPRFAAACRLIYGDRYVPDESVRSLWNDSQVGELSWHWALLVFDALLAGRLTIALVQEHFVGRVTEDDGRYALFVAEQIEAMTDRDQVARLIGLAQMGEHPPG